jgi:hypothetical protein
MRGFGGTESCFKNRPLILSRSGHLDRRLGPALLPPVRDAPGEIFPSPGTRTSGRSPPAASRTFGHWIHLEHKVGMTHSIKLHANRGQFFQHNFVLRGELSHHWVYVW